MSSSLRISMTKRSLGRLAAAVVGNKSPGGADLLPGDVAGDLPGDAGERVDQRGSAGTGAGPEITAGPVGIGEANAVAGRVAGRAARGAARPSPIAAMPFRGVGRTRG